MGSNTSTEKTDSQSVNQIPQWVTNAGEQNYAFAQDVASRPLQQYQGQMVADTAPQTQQAWDLAASSGNVGQDQYGASQAGYLNSLGQTPINATTGNANMIRAGQLSNTNLDPYMNPYTQNVINATLPIYQQNLGLQQNQQQNQANAANAFGGSRQGVQQGVTQAQGAQGMAQMAQQLNAANFGQAQSAAQQDIANRLAASTTNQAAQQKNLDRSLSAQGMNQTAQQQKINSDILASQGLANLGDSQARTNAANFTMLSQAGAGQSMQAQNQINASMAKFNEARNYPNQQLATLLSALGMTPHDTATTGTSTTETTTPTNWGALAVGGLDALSGFFKPTSDKTLKTDITKLGKDSKTGLQMHAYRYKGDPKTYPKVIGPMAQDVEKKFPGATQRQGGKLTVDPSIMSAAGVRGYEDGTSDVQPMDGEPSFLSRVMGGISKANKGGHIGEAFGGQSPPSSSPKIPDGWGAPSQGFLVSGFAQGVARIPGALSSTDTVPAMLTPGEAVLNREAATQLGRRNITQLNMNALMPTKSAIGKATTAPRAGAKAMHGLSNTKLRAPLRGALA